MSENKNPFIDFELVEKHLIQISSHKIFIFPDTFYSYQTVQKLSLLKEKFGSFFSKVVENPKNKSSFFLLEVKCPACGHIRKESVSRHRFMTLLNNLYRSSISGCHSCRKKGWEKIHGNKEQRKEKDHQSRLLQQEEKEKLIQKYIDDYLNPNASWASEISSRSKISYLENAYIAYDEKIINHIKNMPYNLFLQTPYWKAISEYKRGKAGFKCELCNSNKSSLNVHHRTYEIRGKEIFNLPKLIVLCEKCHLKFHDIKKG